jgi:esterase/lipase superfamily enzyme
MQPRAPQVKQIWPGRRRAALGHLGSFALAVLFILLSNSGALAYSAEGQAAGVAVAVPAVGVFFAGRHVYRSIKYSPDLYRVWYGTNRKRQEFSYYKYLPGFGDGLSFGTCLVAVPKSHKFGSLGSSRLWRVWMKIIGKPDDRLTIKETTKLSPEAFDQSIALEMAKFSSDQKSCLLYIHGFNVSFEEAALRAAQIGFDLKVPGVMAFFSWPSKANGVSGYLADGEAIAASEGDLAEFIIRLSAAIGNARMHVLVHSMGNQGVLRALNDAKRQAELAGVAFGQIFLAAPDVDVALFRRLADIYPRLATRTTLYVSNADRALSLSTGIHSNQRTGYTPPVTVIPGIDTVEVSQIDVGLLGHSYYGEASAVLFDMYILLRGNVPPAERPGLVAETVPTGANYWVVRGRAT